MSCLDTRCIVLAHCVLAFSLGGSKAFCQKQLDYCDNSEATTDANLLKLTKGCGGFNLTKDEDLCSKTVETDKNDFDMATHPSWCNETFSEGLRGFPEVNMEDILV